MEEVIRELPNLQIYTEGLLNLQQLMQLYAVLAQQSILLVHFELLLSI